MQKEIILFDLDGTLTESGPGIVHSARLALEKLGCGPLPDETLQEFIGPPLLQSIIKYGGVSREEAYRGIGYFREYYESKGMYENSVYPGVTDMLESLRAAGKVLAVATSKPEETARKILEHFGLTPYFSVIVGASRDESKVEKADIIAEVLQILKVDETKKPAVVMVGDRRHDILGAKENGIASLGVLYGYGSREELQEAGADLIAATAREAAGMLCGGCC